MIPPAWIDNRAAEFRYALRMIRKTPGASAVAVLSLALGIGAQDPLTIAIAALILISVAALASFIPARRATRVDPILPCDPNRLPSPLEFTSIRFDWP
jgi:hypothetical protein